jgi:hypothetical protein
MESVENDASNAAPERQPIPKMSKFARRLPPFFTWSLEGEANDDIQLPKTPSMPANPSGLKQILSSLAQKVQNKILMVLGNVDEYGVESEFRYGRYYKHTPNVTMQEL